MALIKEMQFISTPDNIQLYMTSWMEEKARGAVLIVHGIGEHSARYLHVVAALNVRGYSVFTYDQRGHGKSGGPRLELEEPTLLPDDLGLVHQVVAESTFGLPLFIYGHSMGSLVTLAYAEDHQDSLAGLILSGAPTNIDARFSPAVVFANRVANRFVPKMKTLELVDTKALSRDPAVVRVYEQDPLNYHGRVPVRTNNSLMDMLNTTRDRLSELTLPLLLLHGEADTVCPPSGSVRIHQEAASEDKTLILYPDLYHEIHNEPQQVTVIRDILDWLDSHTEETDHNASV